MEEQEDGDGDDDDDVGESASSWAGGGGGGRASSARSDGIQTGFTIGHNERPSRAHAKSQQAAAADHEETEVRCGLSWLGV